MATIPGCVKEDRIKTPVRDRRSAKTDRLSPVAALVRRHDRDRFQTVLFAPAARREALFALYAFNYEIASVRERVTEPTLGRIRFEWWCETIAVAYEGGPVRRHIVAEPLTAAIREHALSREHFDRLIDARERDLDDEPLASLAGLEDYAEATSARLVYLALEILGVRDQAAHRAGSHVGIAYIAARAGLDAGDYRALRTTTALRAGIAEIAAAASHHLGLARALRPALERAALPALLPAVVAARFLRRLERAGYDPFDPALATPDPLQSWRLAAAALFNRF
jgi:NADH dehydrogenase [ubiquinone] 1 alpha subcomplex assembly factor 6